MASDWRNVMGAVAKQALGAKALRALGKTKRNTRRRQASKSVRHAAKGRDRHKQILRNYVESLELTNPSDGFEADDDDSDAEDYEESDSEDSDGGGRKARKSKAKTKRSRQKPRRKRARRKGSPITIGTARKKKTHRQRHKSLTQVLTEHYSAPPDQPSAFPDYLSAAASSDGRPRRRFCYVTGQPAKYKDVSTGSFHISPGD